MNDSLSELFKDDDYCVKEICQIRESIGTINANQKTFNVAHSALAFMLLNCSEKMRPLVLGQLMETTKRENYAFLAGQLSKDSVL